MKVDTSPRLISKCRFRADREWVWKRDTEKNGAEKIWSGFYSVPGVGIAQVEFVDSYLVGGSRRAKARVVYGRFSATAYMQGTRDDNEEDLIVMAARAALAEAKRTSRKRRKKAVTQ